MEITFDIINKHLVACWLYYKWYVDEFNKTHYSDATPDDFVDWCVNNLMYCVNCNDVYVKDEQERLYDDYNADNVCDSCIEELDYYD